MHCKDSVRKKAKEKWTETARKANTPKKKDKMKPSKRMASLGVRG